MASYGIRVFTPEGDPNDPPWWCGEDGGTAPWSASYEIARPRADALNALSPEGVRYVVRRRPESRPATRLGSKLRRGGADAEEARKTIREALEMAGGNIRLAAEFVGMSRERFGEVVRRAGLRDLARATKRDS